MELLEGIKSRKSIRAFKPDAVPGQVLMELLKAATRAPSSVNIQPWEFFVVRGQALKELKRMNLEEHRLGRKPNPEIPIGETRGMSAVLEGIFRERQIELAKQIFRIMGIPKGDKAAMEAWNERMVQFYDAPAAIIIVMDKLLEVKWPLVSIGLVIENIVLGAQAYGLGTCIMRAIVDYPEKVREIVGIPESKRTIVGIAIGYPDEEHPIYRLETHREQIEKVVTFVE